MNQRKKGVDASLKADLKNAAIVVDTFIVDHPTEQGVDVGDSAGSLTVDSTPPPLIANLSPGNVVSVNFNANGSGYCLEAWNAGASVAVAGSPMTYNSTGGGLGKPCT